MTQDQLAGRAAHALVDESAVEMTADSGGLLEIWTIACEGSVVRASAPRLEVREGMQLRCRLMVDGAPHTITALVEQAEFQSQSRAALLLRVLVVETDGDQRRSARIDVALSASVTAVVCDRLVPGETVSAVLEDISEGGVALALADMRVRERDRLRVRVRVFEGTIDSEVRVMSTRGGESAGTLVAGCAFLDPSPHTVEIVTRLLARLNAPAAHPVPEPGVRETLGIGAEPKPAPPSPRPAPLHRPGLA
ncbi:MAG TPA: PilZ domain-containing protein [Gaiellales bacterium]|nr:PilZ domain-containing protein [Gaiellales bacterium]